MNHIGRETTVEVNGKKYRLSRFTRKILRSFLDWANVELGNPLDAIKDRLAGFPPHLQEMIVKDALEQARLRRSVNSPEVQSLLATPQGSMKLLSLLFQQHHPELTDADVEAIYDACATEHGESYLEKKIVEASGQMPKDESEIEREALQEAGLLPGEKKG